MGVLFPTYLPKNHEISLPKRCQLSLVILSLVEASEGRSQVTCALSLVFQPVKWKGSLLGVSFCPSGAVSLIDGRGCLHSAWEAQDVWEDIWWPGHIGWLWPIKPACCTGRTPLRSRPHRLLLPGSHSPLLLKVSLSSLGPQRGAG